MGYAYSGSISVGVSLGISGASYGFSADITARNGNWYFTAGVNAWLGLRLYGTVYGEASFGVSLNTCDLANVKLRTKLKIGGDIGFELGGEAFAYVKAGWGFLYVGRRVGIGLAGGGRLGVEWDADLVCDMSRCTIEGPAVAFMEGYVRFHFMGYGGQVGIREQMELGRPSLSFPSPLAMLISR